MEQEDVNAGEAPKVEAGATGGFSSRIGKAKEAVGEKYTAASDAVKDKYTAASDAVKDKYATASDAVKGAYTDARGKVGETYKQVKTKVDDIDFEGLVDQGRAYVRSNPGKALLISVGVGFVIGLLLRRGDDE